MSISAIFNALLSAMFGATSDSARKAATAVPPVPPVARTAAARAAAGSNFGS
ncbi:hypothetical protein GS421_02495 [Rhodococcus hoagii]|nr:hypothetical protein [Prescottella equi]